MATSRHLTLRSGGAACGPSDLVSTTQNHPLGTRAWDSTGNEYIYVKGVASGAAGDLVTYDEDYTTTRLAPDAVGPVALFDAALDATTKFGWAQVFGVGLLVRSDTVATDLPLYIDTGAGRCDDAGVSGDLIWGLFSRTTDTYSGAANLLTVWMNYPYVTNLSTLTGT